MHQWLRSLVIFGAISQDPGYLHQGTKMRITALHSSGGLDAESLDAVYQATGGGIDAEHYSHLIEPWVLAKSIDLVVVKWDYQLQ